MKSSKKPAPAVRPSAKAAKPAKALAGAAARKVTSVRTASGSSKAKPRGSQVKAASQRPPTPAAKPAEATKGPATKAKAIAKRPVALTPTPAKAAPVTRKASRAKAPAKPGRTAKVGASTGRTARKSSPTAKPSMPVPEPPAVTTPTATKVHPVALALAREAVALPRRPRPVRIPPLLLEGDESAEPLGRGPGARAALGAPVTAAVAPGTTPEASPVPGLPESYGTRQLWLAARDPHWLFASWDFSAPEIEALEARAAAGHLTLRVYEGEAAGAPLVEVMLAKGAGSWFVHVGRAGAAFRAELGLALAGGGWETLAQSAVVETPAEAPAPASTPTFTTIPVDVPFRVVLAAAAEAVRASEPVQAALEDLREQGFVALPAPEEVRRENWTPEQERALAEVLRVNVDRRVHISSLDVTEAVSRELAEAGAAAAQPGEGAVPGPTGAGETGGLAAPPPVASSPVSGFAGAPGAPRDFWFNVNAELVIYGATEPDATLRVAGRRLALRPDGSFSLRFALPDGEFELPVMAASADGMETRHAELRFVRRTEYAGEVGRHPQDERLRPPTPDGVEANETR